MKNANKSPQITFSRKITPMKILKDGVQVGEIYRSLTRPSRYILELQGKYWRYQATEPTTSGGAVGKWYGRLYAAKEAAIRHMLTGV